MLAAPDASDTARQEMAGCLLPMIQSLPDHYGQAVMLSEIEGLPQKEVAARQGISLSGAKSRVQRGRSMIKDMMLACCHLEFDRLGNVMDYEENGEDCICGAC